MSDTIFIESEMVLKKRLKRGEKNAIILAANFLEQSDEWMEFAATCGVHPEEAKKIGSFLRWLANE